MNGIVGMSTGKRYLNKRDDKIVMSVKNRFYQNTLLPNDNGCMLWIGIINKLGYGTMAKCMGYNTIHRYSYFLHYGEFNKKLHVLHKCDIRNCVAPDHLFLGTHQDNMNDMIKKGRLNNRNGENASNIKLTKIQVSEIRKRLANGDTHISIANDFKVHKTTITAINIGRNWKELS